MTRFDIIVRNIIDIHIITSTFVHKKRSFKFINLMKKTFLRRITKSFLMTLDLLILLHFLDAYFFYCLFKIIHVWVILILSFLL